MNGKGHASRRGGRNGVGLKEIIRQRMCMWHKRRKCTFLSVIVYAWPLFSQLHKLMSFCFVRLQHTKKISPTLSHPPSFTIPYVFVKVRVMSKRKTNIHTLETNVLLCCVNEVFELTSPEIKHVHTDVVFFSESEERNVVNVRRTGMCVCKWMSKRSKIEKSQSIRKSKHTHTEWERVKMNVKKEDDDTKNDITITFLFFWINEFA